MSPSLPLPEHTCTLIPLRSDKSCDPLDIRAIEPPTMSVASTRARASQDTQKHACACARRLGTATPSQQATRMTQHYGNATQRTKSLRKSEQPNASLNRTENSHKTMDWELTVKPVRFSTWIICGLGINPTGYIFVHTYIHTYINTYIHT